MIDKCCGEKLSTCWEVTEYYQEVRTQDVVLKDWQRCGKQLQFINSDSSRRIDSACCWRTHCCLGLTDAGGPSSPLPTPRSLQELHHAYPAFHTSQKCSTQWARSRKLKIWSRGLCECPGKVCQVLSAPADAQVMPMPRAKCLQMVYQSTAWAASSGASSSARRAVAARRFGLARPTAAKAQTWRSRSQTVNPLL